MGKAKRGAVGLMLLAGIAGAGAQDGPGNRGLSPIIKKADRVIGVCHLAQNPPIPINTAVNTIGAALEVKDYLTKFENKEAYGLINFKILKQPTHGVLKDIGGGNYRFVPEEGYLGKDQATILVEMSGMKIKVRYFFQVLDSLPTDSDEQKYCPRYKWKITDNRGRTLRFPHEYS